MIIVAFSSWRRNSREEWRNTRNDDEGYGSDGDDDDDDRLIHYDPSSRSNIINEDNSIDFNLVDENAHKKGGI